MSRPGNVVLLPQMSRNEPRCPACGPIVPVDSKVLVCPFQRVMGINKSNHQMSCFNDSRNGSGILSMASGLMIS